MEKLGNCFCCAWAVTDSTNAVGQTKRHIHPNLIRPRKKLKQFLIGYPDARAANFGSTLLP
jgi:hypothetical protein